MWGVGLIPGSERAPGEGNGNLLQYSCLENPMDRGACGLQSIGPWRVGHYWSDLAHAHAWAAYTQDYSFFTRAALLISMLGQSLSKRIMHSCSLGSLQARTIVTRWVHLSCVEPELGPRMKPHSGSSLPGVCKAAPQGLGVNARDRPVLLGARTVSSPQLRAANGWRSLAGEQEFSSSDCD